MYTNDKNDVIRLRLSKEVKTEFQAICKKKAVNPSELLRQFITQWTYEQSQPTNPQRRATDITNINQ